MKATILSGVAALVLVASPAMALDVERFGGLVDKTLAAIDEGDVNIQELLGYQDQLIEIGISGAHTFGEANAEFAETMTFIAANTDQMKALNLEEIEVEWHSRGAMEAAGLDVEAFDEDDDAVNHMEAIVHPATAHIALRAYEVTGDDAYLEQVVDELTEIMDHLAE